MAKRYRQGELPMDSCKKHWEHRVIIGIGTMANYNPFNMVDKITIGASVHFMSGNFLCLHVFFHCH